MRKILVIAISLCAPCVFAASRTWDDGGTGSAWSTSANWSSDLKPTASDDAVFTTTDSGGTSTVDEDFTIGNYRIGSNTSIITHTMSIPTGTTLTLNTLSTYTVGVNAEIGNMYTEGGGSITINTQILSYNYRNSFQDSALWYFDNALLSCPGDVQICADAGATSHYLEHTMEIGPNCTFFLGDDMNLGTLDNFSTSRFVCVSGGTFVYTNGAGSVISLQQGIGTKTDSVSEFVLSQSEAIVCSMDVGSHSGASRGSRALVTCPSSGTFNFGTPESPQAINMVGNTPAYWLMTNVESKVYASTWYCGLSSAGYGSQHDTGEIAYVSSHLVLNGPGTSNDMYLGYCNNISKTAQGTLTLSSCTGTAYFDDLEIGSGTGVSGAGALGVLTYNSPLMEMYIADLDIGLANGTGTFDHVAGMVVAADTELGSGAGAETGTLQIESGTFDTLAFNIDSGSTLQILGGTFLATNAEPTFVSGSTRNFSDGDAYLLGNWVGSNVFTFIGVGQLVESHALGITHFYVTALSSTAVTRQEKYPNAVDVTESRDLIFDHAQ